MDAVPVVQLCGVSRRFADVKAVVDLDFVVRQGEVVGLLGPNGSGKSTTLAMILGELVPTAGTVRVFGEPPRFSVRQRMGYLPEQRGLYEDMTAIEQISWFARMAGVARKEADRRAAYWMERLGLAERHQALLSELSKGMQQRVQLAVALINQPDLLVLDEPFSGLDPVSQEVFSDVVHDEKRRGATVLLCTHVIAHAERSCDRVVCLVRGHKRLDDTVANLSAAADDGVSLWARPGERSALQAALRLSVVREVVAAQDGSLQVRLAKRADPAELLRGLLAAGVTPERWSPTRLSLHERVVQTIRAEGDVDWEGV